LKCGGGGSLSLFFQPLFFEPGFGDGQKESAFETVLFAVLAYWRIRVREHITSGPCYKPFSHSL
jgi:hypothetical protein